MTNFIQKTHLDIGFSAFNCLLDSQCSLLTSQILGSCIKLKWSNRAYAVYWLRWTLLYPWGNMDNILDKRDSKGKVGGGRKEQKVWVLWKEEKRREMWRRMTSGAQMMSPVSALVKRRDQGARGRGALGAKQDLGKERDKRWRTERKLENIEKYLAPFTSTSYTCKSRPHNHCDILSEKMPSVSVKDVSQQEFTVALAAFLKK